MRVKSDHLNKRVLQSSALSALILSVLGLLILYFIGLNWISFSLFLFSSFAIVFLVFKASMKGFILKQLQKVYDSSLFENQPFLKRESNELDFEKFLQKVRNFAENKHEEIEQLHDRDDFRKEFLGDVSHELKTPLFTAQGYLLTVLDGSMDDEELEKKYLFRTKKSLDRLSSIVKDLDTLAKLESGLKLNQEPFNIVQCAREVMDMLEFSAEKKDISLEFGDNYDYPIRVRAEKEKIEQVLINLIQNSINYGKVGGSTRLFIRSHSPHKVLIEVRDDGVGIHDKDLPRIFERFYRADKSRSREHGGSGLGLAIVKHILEAHDQETFVESKPGQGTSFSFTLNKAD